MTPPDGVSSRERVFMVVAVVAAFCSSACLFLLELIAGKFLLPRFGGAPGVWTSCLAFFQLSLVAAYWYADRVIRTLSPRSQVIVQALLFVAAWIVATLGLGVTLVARPESSLPLALIVMAFLAVSVGPVFFAVATLAPLFAHWRTLWGGGRDAHWLYAAGNAGSFAVLAAYPLAIEPAAGLSWQASMAGRCFVAVGLLTLACGTLAVIRRPGASAPRPSTSPPTMTPSGEIGWTNWLRWAVLAALPASWLASVTTHATVEIAPIPLLWVVPLAAYLASFVIVFAPWGRHLRRFEPLALSGAVGVAAWMLAGNVSEPVGTVLAAHITAFFVVCICLHGMLVDDRPPAERLSSFYLAMAAGGACGGLFNAIVAPAVFDAHHEFPLAVAATAALVPAFIKGPPPRRWAAAAVAGLAIAGMLALAPWFTPSRTIWLAVIATAVATILVSLRGRERVGAFALLLAATFVVDEAAHRVCRRSRTFFGVLRVCEDDNGPSRRLMHGGITHGAQLVSDDRRRRAVALSYYHQAGPLGSVFRGMELVCPPRRVGVAGLGVGTIASYAKPGQEFVFFEIDPAVVQIASDARLFTFLADCLGDVRLVTDDARLALEREPDGSIDLLVVDAFTGDSVPTHLLTREAFALYGRKVSPEGAIALHVSNKYLDFVPVVEALAADGGWMALQGRDEDVPSEYARSPSEWMALSRSLGTVKAIYTNPTSDRWIWKPTAEKPNGVPWTDDRTAVADAMRR
jgi:hypothetical protein